MVIVETRLKKWGNSFGVIIPREIVDIEKMKEEEKISIIVIKKNSKALKETFGIGKGKITKSGQEFKDETRRELYSN